MPSEGKWRDMLSLDMSMYMEYHECGYGRMSMSVNRTWRMTVTRHVQWHTTFVTRQAFLGVSFSWHPFLGGQIAAEYDKLAGVLFRAGQYPRALAYIDRAVPLLRCFYGERHEGVAELGVPSIASTPATPETVLVQWQGWQAPKLWRGISGNWERGISPPPAQIRTENKLSH